LEKGVHVKKKADLLAGKGQLPLSSGFWKKTLPITRDKEILRKEKGNRYYPDKEFSDDSHEEFLRRSVLAFETQKEGGKRKKLG